MLRASPPHTHARTTAGRVGRPQGLPVLQRAGSPAPPSRPATSSGVELPDLQTSKGARCQVLNAPLPISTNITARALTSFSAGERMPLGRQQRFSAQSVPPLRDAQNRKLEAAPIAIIHPAAAPTAAGSGDPSEVFPVNACRFARRAAFARASQFMAGRVGRPSGLPAPQGPVRQPRRQARHPSSGDERQASSIPVEASCQVLKAGIAPRRIHLRQHRNRRRPRHPTQAGSPRTAPT